VGLYADSLDSVQRVKSLLDGRPVDRVPVFPFALGFCARNVGYPLSSVYEDPGRSLEAQLWTQEMYAWDSPPFYGYASYGSWEFGGQIEFPSSELQQAPSVPHYPVQSEDDIERLELPDVTKAGMLPRAMEFSRKQQALGLPISLVVGGVFTIAGNICGVDRLCRWMIKKPELCQRLVQMGSEHLIDVVRLWVKTFGPDNMAVQIWEPLASNQIISPRQFQQFVLPHQRDLHRTILDMGIRQVLCHICGEQNLNLPYWTEIPMGDPGIVSFGHEVDLATAIDAFGHSCVVAGNIEPAVIQDSTPQQVYELTRRCIEKGRLSPRGYILMPGCELPPMAPPYNVHMMMKAVNDYGRYE